MSKKQNTKKEEKEEKQAFLRQITEVTPDTIKVDASMPDCSYEIDHVYGFSGDRNKACLYFGKNNNEIVFPTAALGIVQDLTNRKQRFFGGGEKGKEDEKYLPGWPVHQDDITTLDIAGGEHRNIVASGECGKMSTVHIWDSNTMTSIANFSLGSTAKGVAALSISPCQRYVAAVDQSNDHTMYIYNVQRKKMLLQLGAGSDSIYNIQWSKKPNDLKFVAVTSRSLQFWNPADASKKLFKNGTFGAKFQQTRMTCATFDEDGICYSGGENGGVHIWDQKQDLGLVLKAHAGSVSAVTCNQGTLVSTGKDDMLSVFAVKEGEYQFLRQIPLDIFHQASSLDLLDGKVLIGHDNGRIQTVNLDGTDKQLHNFSHFDGEAWGLEVLQEKGTFLTCGDDNQIYEFSIKDKKLVKSGKVWTFEQNNNKAYETKKIKSTASTLSGTPVHMQARGITYDTKWNHVAVSNNYGDISIVDYNDFSKKIATLYKPREWCETLVYSPNHEYLAVGSHDDSIYIYKITEKDGKVEYTMHWSIFYVHSSAVVGMDWSRDSKYLRAVDQAYAKIFYDVEASSQVPDGMTSLTDPSMWQTSTCKLGWEVAGVFPPGTDGTDINAVDANDTRTHVVCGDDFGSITVYKFPCTKNSQPCRRMTGHSEHVPRVRFYNKDEEDTYIISAGGNDRTYIQWKEVPAPDEEEESKV